jgi:beta-N-acetylhexosaminidase
MPPATATSDIAEAIPAEGGLVHDGGDNGDHPCVIPDPRPHPFLSRRRFLGAALAAGAALVAACLPSTNDRSPTPSVAPATGRPTALLPLSPSASLPASPTASASPAADLRRTIAGLLVVGFRGFTVAEAGPLADAIARDGLGGVILFDRDQTTGGSRNVRSPKQLRALTAGLQNLAGQRRLIVAIDQEGGRVARLNPTTGFPSVASEASIGRLDDEAAATTWGRLIATTLASVGVNLNLAPVVDLNVNAGNPAIGALDRSFSADPAVVTKLALAEIRAHHESSIATALKHFPGLGSATANTDFGVADVTRTWSRTELEPFRAIVASGVADAVMAGHLVNRNLDRAHPASLSSAIVTGLLRGELGWNGVVITDDLGAAAITSAFGAEEAIALAIEAGNDLLLLANQQSYDPDRATKAIDTIEGLVRSGRISAASLEESRGRVDALLARLAG